MALRDLIRDLLSDSGLQPSALTFPDVDVERIAGKLDLRREGSTRGAKGQPRQEFEVFDNLELTVVDHVGSLRKAGLDRYQEMRSVYARRIERASQVRQAIITAAQTVRGDLLAEATTHRAVMAGPLRKVTDSLEYMRDFRERNDLRSRPYLSEKPGWPSLVLIVAIAVVIETVLNGLMFADADPGGLLGGVTVAAIISVTNVTASSVFGLWARYKNHRRLLSCLGGILSIFMFIAFAASFNLLIGHYRDALQLPGYSIAQAGQTAVEALIASPLNVNDVKSILLIVMGLTISVIAALKAYASFDPYPGYNSVYWSLESALTDYADSLRNVNKMLEQKRDTAIQEFRDAQSLSARLLSEASDAMLGHTALQAQLQNFLETTNTKVNRLLQIYRDSNMEARPFEAGIPRSFLKAYRFPDVPATTSEATSLEAVSTREERELIARAIEEAVRDVAAIHDAYVRYFPSVDDLRGGWMATSLPSWEETLHQARMERLREERVPHQEEAGKVSIAAELASET